MSSSRWTILEELYERARALPSSARSEFLDNECRDSSMRAELETLLAIAEEAEALFDALLDTQKQIDYGRELSHGIEIGGYRVLEPLGHGGMGAVFLAERTVLDVKQRVAVKIVRLGVADRGMKARLLDEGRLLTRLEHPAIARFIDGGVTLTGQPFYVMEYVDGIPLLEYADQGRLTVDERLEMFLDVCDAVQFAHQQLVVHRDLKPDHILIDADRSVKLLDFGMAKILESPDPTSAADRATRPWITPAYASPEQVRGAPIGTASDQYALGVVLYELMTGCRPYRILGLSPREIEEVVCNTAPSRPSEVVRRSIGYADQSPRDESATPTNRKDIGRLSKRLSGDLDNIVLKALAKEPSRRYDSVSQLADDIRDHLHKRPIRARPDHFTYRLSRYIKRNGTAVVAGCFVFAALVGGTIVSVWQASLARWERDRTQAALRSSEQVQEFITELLWSDDPAVARVNYSPSEVLRRGLERARDSTFDPAVRAKLLDALGWAHVSTADFAQARVLLEEALALGRGTSRDGDADFALTLSHLSVPLHRLGHSAQAESVAREALLIQERLYGTEHPLVAESLTRLATAISDRDPLTAVAILRRVLGMRRRIHGTEHTATAMSIRFLADQLVRVDQHEEAELLLREAVSIREHVFGPEDPRNAPALIALGNLLYINEPAVAERLYERALTIQENAYDALDPRLTTALSSLGGALVRRGSLEEGFALLHRTVEIELRTWGPDNLRTAAAMGSLAGRFRDVGKHAEAESMYWEVLRIERHALGERHLQTAGRLLDIGRSRMARGDLEGAEGPMLEGLAIRREHGNRGRANALIIVSELYCARGDFQEAEVLLNEALAFVESLPNKGGSARTRVLDALGSLYEEWGRVGEAARVRNLPRS